VTGKAEFEEELQHLARTQGDEVRMQRSRERTMKLSRAVELLKEAINVCSENEDPK
jgi:hypothetical protein